MIKATDLEVAKKLVQIARSASDRGYKCNLTLRTIRRLMNTEKCFFTGVVMNDRNGDPLQRTFDRINNRQGYVEGNVVACCKSINNKKGELTVAEIKQLYLGLKRKKLV